MWLVNMGAVHLPEYWTFNQYENDVLEPRARTEQLTMLDDEIVNMSLLPRYRNDLERNEWGQLRQHYSQLFADFVVERVQDATETTPIEESTDQFDTFRDNIVTLNSKLASNTSRSVTTISEPAERILLKQLRRKQYDPEALNVSHIEQGSGLYLLELFVTAGQQEARRNADYLPTLIEEAQRLDGLDTQEARALLSHPVLMVSLWKNQQEGLERWLDNGKKGILEMATATGKTVAGIAAIAHLCGDRPDASEQTPVTDDAAIMVVAHSNAILSQWETEIADKLGLATSALSGSGQPDTLQFETGTVEFHTAQSLLPRYDRDLADCYDLVIYDEVHHYSNVDGFGQAIRRPNYDAVMGLSATIGEEQGPKRQKLENLVAPVVYTYGVEDATKDGIIPDFEWTVHPTALDPDERTEWEETTESITNQFRYIQYDDTTRDILSNLSVPFVEMEDLGDFIQAYQAAEFELDRDIPDEWQQLQASIQSRNWIRHRSQPKLDGALELAEEYLTNVDRGVKLVMFAMDIETTERIGEALSEVTDDVYVVHSQVASSSRKKDRIVRQRIDQFANADHGVLIAPKLLDEGIDVPDAEVGINVAGTKTKLQLVQRMGRILRKHADQQPHFHHFVAVPDEHHIEGLDGKHYVQELNWVRELGEAIGEQPSIEEAHVDSNVLERAEERGHELWAQDLLADLEIETVQGTVYLGELIEDITLCAAKTLHTMVDFGTDELVKEEWKTAMDELRSDETITVDVLQRVWWLFPLYREEPAELEELLTAIIDKREEQTNEDTESGNSRDAVSETADETTKQSTEESVVSPVPGDDESSEEDNTTTGSVTADSEETTGESKVTTALTSSVDNESKEEPERLTPSDILPENTSEQDETSTGETGRSSSQKQDGGDKRDTDGTQGLGKQPLAEPASAAGAKSNSGVAQETGGTSEPVRNDNSGQVGRTVENTSPAETDAVGTRNRIPNQQQSNQSPQDTEEKEDTGAGFVGRIRSILGL